MGNKRCKRVWPRARDCGLVRASGFTIVDLLMVILVSFTAVAILLPVVRSAAFRGPIYMPRALRKNLEDGAENYKQAHRGYYPGQQHLEWVGSAAGKYTGSQVLAACVFGYEDEGSPANPFHKIDRDDPEATDKYAYYKDEYLTTLDGRKNVLCDMFSAADTLWGGDDMAFCYYIRRKIGVSELVTREYEHADNAAHTEGREAGSFGDFLSDERVGDKTPYHSGGFLLIAPGGDREYFNEDDIRNWRD